MRTFVLKSCALVMALAASGALFAAPNDIKPATVNVPSRVCNINDFGARGTSIWYDTEAVQKAIDSCAEQGGGKVVVPAGYYLIGPIFLKANIQLDLARGAVLQAAADDAMYHPVDANRRWAGVKNLWPNADKWLALINVADDNVAITGEGTIDGLGATWWERWRAEARASGKRGSTNRPRLVFIKDAKNVLIQGVTLTNSPSFHVVFYNVDGITIDRTRIIAPDYAQNTDAIDPMDSRNIRITRNTISVGDDHVAIKSVFPLPSGEPAVQNVYIANNTFLNGRGLSIGSESSGGVKGVLAENNVFRGSMYGIRIKSPRGIGGVVRDVTYRNTKMENVDTPIVLAGYYKGGPYDPKDIEKALQEGEFKGGFVLGNQIYPSDADPVQAYNETKTPYFDDIRFEKLTSTGASTQAAYIVGTPEKPFTRVVFNDVSIKATRGMQIRNAAVSEHGLRVTASEGKATWIEAGGTLERK